MELRRVAPVVGLVALLAADAVLIAWAFRPVPAEDYVSVASAVSSSSASPTRKSSPKPSRSQEPAPVTRSPIAQFITAVGPRSAWVVRSGSCTDPAMVWVTNDEGDTWRRNDGPGRVMRLVNASSATSAQAVGGGKDCELRLWPTSTGGIRWGPSQSASSAWSRMPEDEVAVHTALGDEVRPCGARAVVDLTALDARRAQVLCQNGDVRSTTDGGTSWPRLFTDTKALALSMAEGGNGVLVRTDPSCEGVVALPISSGKRAESGECVESAPTTGRVSVSTTGDSWWLLVDTQVYRADENVGPWNPTQGEVRG